jgi:hypothetical protein
MHRTRSLLQTETEFVSIQRRDVVLTIVVMTLVELTSFQEPVGVSASFLRSMSQRSQVFGNSILRLLTTIAK